MCKIPLYPPTALALPEFFQSPVVSLPSKPQSHNRRFWLATKTDRNSCGRNLRTARPRLSWTSLRPQAPPSPSRRCSSHACHSVRSRARRAAGGPGRGRGRALPMAAPAALSAPPALGPQSPAGSRLPLRCRPPSPERGPAGTGASSGRLCRPAGACGERPGGGALRGWGGAAASPSCGTPGGRGAGGSGPCGAGPSRVDRGEARSRSPDAGPDCGVAGSSSAQQVGGDGRCGAGTREGKAGDTGAGTAARDPPCSAVPAPCSREWMSPSVARSF